MPDQGSAPDVAAMLKLGQGIRELLAAADALGLPIVGIHLCDALEALQQEVLAAEQTADPDPTNDNLH